jgi:hypothetical protein
MSQNNSQSEVLRGSLEHPRGIRSAGTSVPVPAVHPGWTGPRRNARRSAHERLCRSESKARALPRPSNLPPEGPIQTVHVVFLTRPFDQPSGLCGTGSAACAGSSGSPASVVWASVRWAWGRQPPNLSLVGSPEAPPCYWILSLWRSQAGMMQGHVDTQCHVTGKDAGFEPQVPWRSAMGTGKPLVHRGGLRDLAIHWSRKGAAPPVIGERYVPMGMHEQPALIMVGQAVQSREAGEHRAKGVSCGDPRRAFTTPR